MTFINRKYVSSASLLVKEKNKGKKNMETTGTDADRVNFKKGNKVLSK